MSRLTSRSDLDVDEFISCLSVGSSARNSDIAIRVLKQVVGLLGLPPEKLRPRDHLITDYRLDLDPLDFEDMILLLEQEFQIEISDDDAQNLMTIDEVVSYIVRRLEGRECCPEAHDAE